MSAMKGETTVVERPVNWYVKAIMLTRGNHGKLDLYVTFQKSLTKQHICYMSKNLNLNLNLNL